jgi:hypothetical protein
LAVACTDAAASFGATGRVSVKLSERAAQLCVGWLGVELGHILEALVVAEVDAEEKCRQARSEGPATNEANPAASGAPGTAIAAE